MSAEIGSITIDCADPQRLGAFWSAVLGTPVQASSEDFVVLERPPEGGPFLMLQRVPEIKHGKNRVHLDLTGEPRPQTIRRLTALGATLIAEHEQPGARWSVLADPEGNQFCVS